MLTLFYYYYYLIYRKEKVAPKGQSMHRGASLQILQIVIAIYIAIVQNKTSSYLSTYYKQKQIT